MQHRTIRIGIEDSNAARTNSQKNQGDGKHRPIITQSILATVLKLV
ncbi:MAG: hypothetical protein WCD86_18680 [Ktedonobacteraceae bacterium]